MRITKVYTKSGDSGQTSLASGERVSKASPRVAAYGDVDELNSVVGLARCYVQDDAIQQVLHAIQDHLFVLGADLSSPVPAAADKRADRIRRIAEAEVLWLEKVIDQYNETLPSLAEFILPGGSQAGALLQVARALARRAERSTVALAVSEKINPTALAYLNRLSDLLFVLARTVNRESGASETSAQFH